MSFIRLEKAVEVLTIDMLNNFIVNFLLGIARMCFYLQ